MLQARHASRSLGGVTLHLPDEDATAAEATTTLDNLQHHTLNLAQLAGGVPVVNNSAILLIVDKTLIPDWLRKVRGFIPPDKRLKIVYAPGALSAGARKKAWKLGGSIQREFDVPLRGR
jgi:hypothetical protein